MLTPARAFRVLNEVAVAAAGLHDPAELAAIVVDRARDLLEADAAVLYWYSSETGRLATLAHNDPVDSTPEPPFQPGEGAAGQAFATGRPQSIDAYDGWAGAIQGAVERGIRSGLAVPLMGPERPVGALGLFTRTPRHWTADDESLLVLFAAQVAPAMEAARLFEVSERRRMEAEALAQLVRRGAALSDIRTIIRLITEQATKLLAADYAYLALDAPGGAFSLRGLHGGISGLGDVTVEPARGHPGIAVREGSTMLLENLDDRVRYPADQHPVHSAEKGGTALATPLQAADTRRGALVVGWRRHLVPTGDQVHFAEALAGYAATILESARARERERELAARAAAREAELTAVIQHIPSGVYVADGEGSIILMNEAAIRMLEVEGAPAPTDLAQSPIVVRHPRTRRVLEAEETAVQRALLGERVENEEALLSRTEWSEDKLFEISAIPLEDGSGSTSGAVVVFSDVTRERRLVTELAESEQRFRSLYGMISCGVLVQDAEGRVLDANQPAQEIIGRTLEEMRGKRTGALWKAYTEQGKPLTLEHRPTMLAVKNRSSIHGSVMGVERPTGEIRWLQIDTVPFVDDKGVSAQVVSSFIDITERKKAQEDLAASESQLRAIFDQAPIGLSRVGLDGSVLESNHVLQEMLGYSAEDLRGIAFSALLGAPSDASDIALLREFTEGRRETYVAERIVLRSDGTDLWGSVSASLVRGNNGEPLYLIGMISDISERKAQTELLEYQALHDALTDLPNRTLLHDRLQQAILTAHRDSRPLALLLMDLNRFKDVNDTFGHHLGDMLLQQVGPRIRSLLRESDTVARLGGDEFAVVLPTAGDEAGARLAADRILKALEEPFTIGDRVLEIGGSIGIAICPQHGLDPATLMRRADIAMYVAKRGRLGYMVYAPEHDQHSPGRLALAGELRQAIERNQLVLHWQPQVDLRTKLLAGFEALVRWEHPRHGTMPPDQFLDLAEETGLIGPLGQWVLGAALAQSHAWRSKGLTVPVAVNLSMQNLHDPALPELVAGLLAEWGVEAHSLKIEITETVVMAEPARSLEILARLRGMGVVLSIDDFGTGYSSLAYLKKMPVHEIKIDRSFVVGISRDAEEIAIVRSTIDLGHSLGLTVVAEGAEEARAVEIVAELGCDLVQGFHIAHPMPARQVNRWLASSPHKTAKHERDR